MPSELENAAHLFETFSAKVLSPAVFQGEVPLPAEFLECSEPIPFHEASKQAYRRCDSTLRWGPLWATAWFRVSGRVPAEFAGRPVVLRFSTGTEATLWREGVPYHGLDVNHDFVRLFHEARPGAPLELYIEAACNRPFGVSLFPWESPEEHRRWSEPCPGRLERCSLAVFEEEAWRLWRMYEFVRQLLRQVAPDSALSHRLLETLRKATRAVETNHVAASVSKALTILRSGLDSGAAGFATRCIAIGHAHIDTAWLWPIRETRRKCLRTFSTTLRLMEQYPQFYFHGSQPQQYAWVEEDSPELFGQIAARVREGRWEPGGAMWVEPDCNLPSGESLVRQILHAARYWQEKFGECGRQRYLYLPDTFGYCAALPQIMRLAGLDTFITNKLSWNDTNEFPHLTFAWRGLDGSGVLAHAMPGRDYNSDNRPEMLANGEKRAVRLDRTGISLWLQPFGYGDGGGGPNDETVLNTDLAGCSAGLPAVEHGRIDAFCEELHRRYDELPPERRERATWVGELYLEFHRGTYTSQAWIKRCNRQVEQALRTAEWLTFFGPGAPGPAESSSAMQRLDRAWKLLLLNQFHDILPGSSIGSVYDQARTDLERARSLCDGLIEEGLNRWSCAAGAGGFQQPVLVFNPCSQARSAVIECGGRLCHVPEIPALGMMVFDAAGTAENALAPARIEGRLMSNGVIEVEIDEGGHIASLRSCKSRREACARSSQGQHEPLNQLVLYADVPGLYDAWEIARHAEQPGHPVSGQAERWDVVERHPLRVAIEVERPIGTHSRITQRYMLEAGSPRVDVRTRVVWHESQVLLRALFPVDVRSQFVTCETQFGHIQRPTGANTSSERAMFEVPAHRWMDLSEAGFGVGLLNDCKYGHSCRGNVMGLSLLRSPLFPDPQADRGLHEFTYSLMLHDGDWRAAGVDRQAEALNLPVIVRPWRCEVSGVIRERWSPFEVRCTGAVRVEAAALKRAEHDDRRLLRLVETHGAAGTVEICWHLPIVDVQAVDLLERPMTLDGLEHDSRTAVTKLPVRGFQVCSLSVAIGPGPGIGRSNPANIG